MANSRIISIRYRLALLIGAVFLLGGFAGWLLGRQAGQKALDFINNIHALRSSDPKYKLVSPLLTYESPNSSEFKTYKP